jgi:hypothetical protein
MHAFLLGYAAGVATIAVPVSVMLHRLAKGGN